MKDNNNSKNENDNKQKNGFNKIYVGYKTRVFIYLVFFVTLLILGILYIYKSLSFIEPEYTKYNENSNLDYKVYLKENDFYEEDYLGKDMLYVANLIDKIHIDFDYNFISDKNIDLDFDYSIIGKLFINSSDGKKTYYSKDYVLLDNKELSLDNGKILNINESIKIDYDYYNKLANKFKTSYGVDASSKLLVYFVINNDINKDNEMIVSIPLSEKAIDIKMDYKKVDSSSSLINDSGIKISNILYIMIAVFSIILSIVSFIKLLRLLLLLKDRKSEYDKYIKKLLNEYDRLIVETSTSPYVSNGNIINIDKFSELLDVRDNLKLPIMYYSIVKHHKCCFYITYEDKIYLYSLKSSDMENNK